MEGGSDVLLKIREIGTLNRTSENESRFIGSASGVAFVNTVRQAFSRSEAGSSGDVPSTRLPSSEETIAAREGLFEEDEGTITADERPASDGHTFLPSKDVAQELMVVYFKTWHPLFPFLHGPTYLHRLEAMYSDADEGRTSSGDLCWAVIFRCTFNIAALSRSRFQLPPRTRLDSPAKTQSILNRLLGKNDIPSLQALLSLQLYLVITMSLHMASTVSGCIVRSIFHSGLHRCPFRYKTFSSHDRQLRKRIFWTAYCLDRYLSLALGLPLGIQDSDVDVCLPALEGHQVGKDDRKASEYICSAPTGPRMDEACIHHDVQSHAQNQHETPLRSFAVYSRLTGTALELIHKSIQVRSISWKAMFQLTSDVHSWWDTLSPNYEDGRQKRDSDPSAELKQETALEPDFFFGILYHHIILIIKRPMLSLDPASSDFNSALQSSIGAAKNIIRRLNAHPSKVFIWPGLLSALWMAGLVIAFSTRLNRLCESEGIQDITQCLSLLEAMGDRWVTATRCHTILSDLLVDLRKDHRLPRDRDPGPASPVAPTPAKPAARHRKRRRLDPTESRADPRRHDSTPYQEDASQLSEEAGYSRKASSSSAAGNQGGRPSGRPSTDHPSPSNEWESVMNIPITPNTAVGHAPVDQTIANMLPGMGFPADSMWGMMFDASNADSSPSNLALPYGNASFDAFVNTVGRYEDVLNV